MAQAAVRLGKAVVTSQRPADAGLFARAWAALRVAARNSRAREAVAKSVQTVDVGRETGVRDQ